MTSRIKEIKIRRMSAAASDEALDAVAIEEPLEIKLQGEGKTSSIAVTMRTPGNDFELAVGFLFTEGVINLSDKITNQPLAASSNQIVLSLQGKMPSLKNVERNFYASSSCGVCGKSSIDAIKVASSFVIHEDHTSVLPETLFDLEKVLSKQQAVFSQTGGLHASALFNSNGDFILLREDVGRHNALDKLIGASFLQNFLPLSNKILLLSGRASFELIQKASMAGIPIVAAIGAPSSLAVTLAKEAGITLIGFLRNNRFNIYSGAERVHNNVLA